MKKKVERLTDLRISQVKEIAARKPLVLIPIGTIEWHAGHLPLEWIPC